MDTTTSSVSKGPGARLRPEILVEGLHKSFGANHVLNGVDLTIHRNDIVAIVGGSGCGKTVLLNHILGLLEPDRGRIQVADHDRDGEPLVDLAALEAGELDHIHMHWGVVFQRNALFSGSVYDNISLWLNEVMDMEADAMVRVARDVLGAVALPADDDFLNRDVNELSGGMAKRLAVARALAMNPQVVFYDEPTTGLDPISAAQIHDLIVSTHGELREAGRARTTVIITHDKDLLNRLRPRTVMMHDGRIFFDGPMEAFAKATSPHIRPYFDIMPILHQGRKSPEG